jgi:predicted nucleic acid-binding protein
MKEYRLKRYTDIRHLPYELIILDTNIFIAAAFGGSCCIRIVGSQDQTPLRFGFPAKVRDEVERILNKGIARYAEQLLEMLRERNYACIEVRDSYGLKSAKLEGLSDADKDLVKLLTLDNVKCVVSNDLKDLIYNLEVESVLKDFHYYSENKLFTSKQFCEEFDSLLIPPIHHVKIRK